VFASINLNTGKLKVTYLSVVKLIVFPPVRNNGVETAVSLPSDHQAITN